MTQQLTMFPTVPVEHHIGVARLRQVVTAVKEQTETKLDMPNCRLSMPRFRQLVASLRTLQRRRYLLDPFNVERVIAKLKARLTEQA
mgnify:CR=1 FL=1